MYSEQELTQVINEVIAGKIEAGAFDEAIADAVDDYLVEHPVDITALNGQTITPAVVNASTSMSAPSGSFTTLNGEASPSVKPLYYHPIFLDGTLKAGTGYSAQRFFFSCTIINNSSTAFNTSTIMSELQSYNFLTPVSTTAIKLSDDSDFYPVSVEKHSDGKYYLLGIDSNGNAHTKGTNPVEFVWDPLSYCSDTVNKIN